jgi:hypothetical protein
MYLCLLDRNGEIVAHRNMKAAHVAPQLPIVEAGLAAVLRECMLPRQDGTDLLIMSEGLLIERRGTGEEGLWQGANRVHRHRCLLPAQQRSASSNRGGIDAYPYEEISDQPLIPEFCSMMWALGRMA